MLSRGFHLLQICFIITSSIVTAVKVDPNGYIMYCPCMGRFGNQADHFLGALGFAKSLDRTLVLPPWVEYHWPQPRSVQVQFDKYFQVEPLTKYHRVITMKTFMDELADEVWPVGERKVYCYSARTNGPKKNDCNAKDGNPFGPFWDTFNIEFDTSVFYNPLYYDTKNLNEMKRWKDKYLASEHPVLAFSGAPAPFPVQVHHLRLQRFLLWSDEINYKVDKFLDETFDKQPYVGIHLRLGSDFENACRHLDESPLMFGAAQCLGYRGEHGKPSQEMCYQSDTTIIRDLGTVLTASKLSNVFVATDSADLISKLMSSFPEVQFAKHSPAHPHVDLAVLGRADYFIGNCISTFTAFVKRERDVNNKPSKFWDFPPSKHDEL